MQLVRASELQPGQVWAEVGAGHGLGVLEPLAPIVGSQLAPPGQRVGHVEGPSAATAVVVVDHLATAICVDVAEDEEVGVVALRGVFPKQLAVVAERGDVVVTANEDLVVPVAIYVVPIQLVSVSVALKLVGPQGLAVRAEAVHLQARTDHHGEPLGIGEVAHHHRIVPASRAGFAPGLQVGLPPGLAGFGVNAIRGRPVTEHALVFAVAVEVFDGHAALVAATRRELLA